MCDYLTNYIYNTPCLSEMVVPLLLLQFQCFPSASFKVFSVSRALLHRDGNQRLKINILEVVEDLHWCSREAGLTRIVL